LDTPSYIHQARLSMTFTLTATAMFGKTLDTYQPMVQHELKSQ